MARLKGSGLGGKFSLEATPLVKDGIMYISTGNDDVFALNAKSGEILWDHWSQISQQISTVCCGWLNRGLAMGGPKFLKAHRRLVRVLLHDPPANATDKPDGAHDQDKQAQRPFQSVGRKCVEHQDKPDRYET